MKVKVLHRICLKLFVLPIIIILMTGCKYKSDIIKHGPIPLKTEVLLNQGAYSPEGTVKVKITLVNKKGVPVTIEELGLRIVNISDGSSSLSRELKGVDINWAGNTTSTIELDVNLPEHFNPGAYGVYVDQKEKGFKAIGEYKTFFRIIDHDEITVFDIKTENHKGVPVFKLDGGMSAEYVVEKSAENLTSGISHSWEVNAPGSGPNHVLGTPDFLIKSVNQTVNFYNSVLGKDVEFETVLIAPGFPSIPYISRALQAPVLPLHFLASVNTAKEIQTILKTANDNDIASYATLSHDPSVPYAVAWVKLLGIPPAYQDFIKKHKVKNVVILGSTGTNDGETKAKKLIYEDSVTSEYTPNSIYIMYPGTSPDDVATLNQKIVDLKEFDQQVDFIKITDWESGINPVQLKNFTCDSNTIPNVKAITITAEDLGQLYNLGTYSTLAFMQKNKDAFNGVKGVVFNPYLLAHPVMESKRGFVPLVYWQLVGADLTVNRLENKVFKGIQHYFPKTEFKNQKFWLNSTRNFGAVWSADNLKKELKKRGYKNFIENDYTIDEVWNLEDGFNAPSELRYQEIKNANGFDALRLWNESLNPLTIGDIKDISDIFGGFEVVTE